ncbi:hypothetical protein EV702DRAFT_973833, partial [Suillus placidus]
RCFPLIVNLACKAVLGAITNLNFTTQSFMNAIDCDPITTVQTVVRVVNLIVIHPQCFEAKGPSITLQLLRDIDVCWLSTLLMVERAIVHSHQGIDRFLLSDSFPEFQKYKLGSSEWDALNVFCKVLSVPHAFQQRLSAEKTPTLCNAIPAFEAMV